MAVDNYPADMVAEGRQDNAVDNYLADMVAESRQGLRKAVRTVGVDQIALEQLDIEMVVET